MSLTRDEWVEMWKHIQYLQNLCNRHMKPMVYDLASQDIKFIKDKIQSVIGQME